MRDVLVVDDDPAIRRLIEVVARRAGFAVDSAADGIQATELLLLHTYKVAIIDLMMPRMNGYELIESLRSTVRRPAIVIATAMTSEFTGEVDGEVVKAIIRKPFDIDTMAELIGELITKMEFKIGPDDQTLVDPYAS